MICLYLDTLIIRRNLCSMLNVLNKISLENNGNILSTKGRDANTTKLNKQISDPGIEHRTSGSAV